MIWADLLRQGTATLTAAGISSAPRDARRLAAHVLGLDASRITLITTEAAPADLSERYKALIAQRALHMPVSHLTGTRQFYSRRFVVTPDVLDPRPDTETLIDVALALPWQRVLDLGTGSGCILLTLLAERGGATGIGTDASAAALAIAARNAAELGLSNRSDYHAGSWFAALPVGTAPFDLIVSNPPYITRAEFEALGPDVRLYEPRQALTDNGDGLTAYRQIVADAPARLAPGSWLVLEIGPAQGDAVASLMRTAGFAAVKVTKDIDSRDRVVWGQKPA